MRRRLPRPRASRALGYTLCLVAVAHVAEAVILRRRLRSIARLPDPELADPGARTDAGILHAEGVDATTLASVARDMEIHGSRVVDLVPGDIPAVRALRLLRRVDPERLVTDPLYSPGGAHEVVVCHPSVNARLAARPPSSEGAPGGRSERWDRGDIVRRTVLAQRYAPTSSVLRWAPELRVQPDRPHDRWRELDELSAFAKPQLSLPPLLVGLETAHLALLSGGLLLSPAAGALALAAWSAQPVLVFGSPGGQEGRLHPPDVIRAGLRRLPDAWRANLATLSAGWEETRRAASRRAEHPQATPPDADLFDPARSTCPWCGSGGLEGRLDTTDLLQGKPGRFHLDRCRDCGHIFQNPRLSLQGLDYYYDQFYDGLGEEAAETGFAGFGLVYERRAAAIGCLDEPRAWLDVGAGHGHFCLWARRLWPGCRFDGLDMSDAIDEAARRGWVDTAYRGMFPDLAEGLPRPYDVVSMHHYLEHTRDPRGELVAAAKVLEPGGHLMVEVPDPESPWARRLGRYWLPWFQPQHQHLVPCSNLVEALADTGFEVVSVERGAATMGGDLAMATMLRAQSLGRSPHLPWQPPPSPAQRVARTVAIAAAVPVLAVAHLADQAKDARIRCSRSGNPGNAYRVVARRI